MVWLVAGLVALVSATLAVAIWALATATARADRIDQEIAGQTSASVGRDHVLDQRICRLIVEQRLGQAAIARAVHAAVPAPPPDGAGECH